MLSFKLSLLAILSTAFAQVKDNCVTGTDNCELSDEQIMFSKTSGEIEEVYVRRIYDDEGLFYRCRTKIPMEADPVSSDNMSSCVCLM